MNIEIQDSNLVMHWSNENENIQLQSKEIDLDDRDIVSLRQEQVFVLTYYTWLKALWNELVNL